ncbi:MAG TPA: single-stranded DNA-binding protein [Verrucomicrobia bacterium]|nr:MAG: single-stranded DNA-binding protein [Lentisphaerae bacterium GWF2_57_35]HBA85054.1 single-stranded DNA-binding protein [Verrucomicrobiota bacterium]
MTTLNKVFLAGNLTRDPEVRYTPSGTAVAKLGLAVSDSYTNKAGEKVESTCFVDVDVWARQAETCGEYLTKGSPVLVEGRLQLDQWESKEGEKRSKLKVHADRVQFLGRPRKAEMGDAPEDAGSRAPREKAPAMDEESARSAEPSGNADDLPF